MCWFIHNRKRKKYTHTTTDTSKFSTWILHFSLCSSGFTGSPEPFLFPSDLILHRFFPPRDQHPLLCIHRATKSTACHCVLPSKPRNESRLPICSNQYFISAALFIGEEQDYHTVSQHGYPADEIQQGSHREWGGRWGCPVPDRCADWWAPQWGCSGKGKKGSEIMFWGSHVFLCFTTFFWGLHVVASQFHQETLHHCPGTRRRTDPWRTSSLFDRQVFRVFRCVRVFILHVWCEWCDFLLPYDGRGEMGR